MAMGTGARVRIARLSSACPSRVLQTHPSMGKNMRAELPAASSSPPVIPSWIRIELTAISAPMPTPAAREGTEPALVYPITPPAIERTESWQ